MSKQSVDEMAIGEYRIACSAVFRCYVNALLDRFESLDRQRLTEWLLTGRRGKRIDRLLEQVIKHVENGAIPGASPGPGGIVWGITIEYDQSGASTKSVYFPQFIIGEPRLT